MVLSLLMFLSNNICFTCCVFDGVGKLLVECVCYLLVCGGCFVAEGDSVVVCLGSFFVSYPLYGFPQCVRVLFVISSFV